MTENHLLWPRQIPLEAFAAWIMSLEPEEQRNITWALEHNTAPCGALEGATPVPLEHISSAGIQ